MNPARDPVNDPDPIQLMQAALEQATEAERAGEVPIGAVIWHRPTGRMIGHGFNRRESDHDPTAHAEIIAMRQAAEALRSWRLLDCVMAVTLEPCVMCAGAIINARLPDLIYGCDDPKAGAVRTLYRVCEDNRLNHRVRVIPGILSDPCAALLQSFFQKQRSLGKK